MSRPAPVGVRPTATLSLDLDDTWAYLRTRGEPDWADAPSMLPAAVDRLLPLLAERRLRITVFVVGRDTGRSEGAEAVRALSEAGHEVASHSWLHRGDLSSLPFADIAEDLARTAEAVTGLTGRRPRGFRCPSFGSSPALVQALADGGYDYDASVLPTTLAPLLKLYYRTRMRSRDAGSAGLAASQDLFGPVSGAVRPLGPFRWDGGERAVLELPVSTVPVVRTPMHMSYLQALAERSEAAASGYLRGALWALRARRVPPSFLLHPTDLVDRDDAPGLAFFPGMRRPAARKLDTVREALDALVASFEVVPLGDAALALAGTDLPVRVPGALLPPRHRNAAVATRPTGDPA
ncbi:MAG: polysaccharide deacetylase family protein [Nocardioidaceae bacterium]